MRAGLATSEIARDKCETTKPPRAAEIPARAIPPRHPPPESTMNDLITELKAAGHPTSVIHDADDHRIEDYIGLRDHQLRRKREGPGGDLEGIFIAEGDVVVERALLAGYPAKSVLIDQSRTAPLPDIVPAHVEVFAAGPDVVRRITGMGVHRGMMAVMGRLPAVDPREILERSTRLVVVEGVVNPTNLGVIARSAVGLGADGLLLDPTSVDPLYRRASRVSMGEVFRLPHARLPRFPDGLGQVSAAGFSLLALTPSPDGESIDDVEFAPHEKVALVLGAEGAGLTTQTMDRIGRKVRIPLHRGVDSLNVAAAAAISCYVLGRGRR